MRGKQIALLGLTFKPDTDDMRDAPALSIVDRLLAEGAHVRAFDPVGMPQARPLLPESVQYCGDVIEAVDGADALVVVTEWDAFRSISPEWLRAAMRGKVVVDLRNIFDAEAMQQAGFSYHSIGRPAVHPVARLHPMPLRQPASVRISAGVNGAQPLPLS